MSAWGVSAVGIDDEETEPVHAMFGLSYGNYLVLQRSLLEAMPIDWQRRFCAIIAEIENEFETERFPYTDYMVRARDNGRFVSDPLGEYRRPDRSLIDGLRRSRSHEH